jgi:hypothetical protein
VFSQPTLGPGPDSHAGPCPWGNGETSHTASVTFVAACPDDFYRPLSMRLVVLRRWSWCWPVARRAAFCAAGCLLLLSSCGRVPDPTTGQVMGTETARGIPGVTSSSKSRMSDRSVLSDQIVAAWLSAEQAFDTAALTSDPSEPDLAATTVDPQLTWTRSLLARMRAAGQIARGRIHYGPPSVQLIGSGEAIVQSCADDAEIVVSASTGSPAPGVPGQVDFELFDSTMELSGGAWRLVTQRVGVGQCDRS